MKTAFKFVTIRKTDSLNMHEDRDTLNRTVRAILLIVSDCSIIVYRSFARFLLAVFDAVFLH